MTPEEFVGALGTIPPRELQALGSSLRLGRPGQDPMAKLGTLFTDVADGADRLTLIRARHWQRIMALPGSDGLRVALLERLAGCEEPWATVCRALR